jgi:hypothetical protein
MTDVFPIGFYNNMAMQLTGINEKLEALNRNLVAANKSAGRLALALNLLTAAIALIALVELVHRWRVT